MSKKQVANYILETRIGKGSFASVWKGRVEGSNAAVAVKVINRSTVLETEQLRQEIGVLRRIGHRNIVRFLDLKKSAAHFYLVLEYCAGGDLSQYLRKHGRLAEEQARNFLVQIAAGLCALHREHVLHRDLKPQNILLSNSSDNPVLKIADFGFAVALQPQDMATTVCGSPLYMAPEILRHEPYDAKADLWSVGVILFELLSARPPFTGDNPMQLLSNIERTEHLPFDSIQVSRECEDFLRSLLAQRPQRRLSSSELAWHPYLLLHSAEQGVLFEAGEPLDALLCEWCEPALSSLESGSGFASPLVASPVLGRSPESSPRRLRPESSGEAEAPVQPEAIGNSALPQQDVQFELTFSPSIDHGAGSALKPVFSGACPEDDDFVVITMQKSRNSWTRRRAAPKASSRAWRSSLTSWSN